MRSHDPDDSIIHVDASSKSLDEFSPESAPAQGLVEFAGRPARRAAVQAALSGSQLARRYGAAMVQQARGAVRCIAAAAERGMASVCHTVANLRHHRARVTEQSVEEAKTAPQPFDQPEFDGVVVAILLAIVSIGYGSFLTIAWRQPTETRAALSMHTTLAPTMVAPVVIPVTGSMAEPAVVTERIGARRSADFMSPRALTAMWKRRDTRSLEQAFTGLRQQTLAFHRCGMRKTGDDRAVARCEGSGSTWTIDFQRQAGRWQIANVVTR